mgnify:CR=1 FL=1
MAYIGKTPTVGNFVKLDAITTSSTNSYSLLNGGVAFTPESANHMIVSLNGVIQAPSTAFSVSGSTITFLPSSGTLSSSDVIDFILVLGNVLDIGTPSDSTVTNAKTNFVSTSSNAGLSIKGDGTSSGTGGQLQLNCSNNNHGIKLESPAHSAGQSYTLKFPTGNVTAGKVLKVDSVSGSGTTGIGQLSFGDGGGLVKLLDATISSAVAQYDIDSTYINSTYNDYQLIANLHPASNTVHFEGRFIVGGVVDSGSNYGFETFPADGGAVGTADTASYMRFTRYQTGNDTGEGVFLNARITNVNSTNFPCCMEGQLNQGDSNGNPTFNMFGASFRPSSASKVVNGIRLFFGSGNIEFGNIKLYGVT